MRIFGEQSSFVVVVVMILNIALQQLARVVDTTGKQSDSEMWAGF